MRFFTLAFCFAAGCFSPDLGSPGFFCHNPPIGQPECPDGTTCLPWMSGTGQVRFRCQKPTNPALVDMAGGLVVKVPPPYTGLHSDPGLNDVASCPDASLEPNDSQPTALEAPKATPDMPTPKVTKMSICPKGPRPETGNHDVDYFHIATTTFPQTSLTMKVELFYDITFGDLDLALMDSAGNVIASDGTAATNACVVKTVTPGDYYAVVVGANNVDVNRYDIRMRTFTTAQTCPPPGL